MIVIDTSVWLDLFLEDSDRKKIAGEFMKAIEVTIYEPEVFEIELAGTLSRRFGRNDVLSFIDDVISKVRLIENPNELAFQIALNTGCRAIDSYFVATAKLTNSILVTNDKIMVKNAKKAGIEAYYLIEEFDKAVERLKEIK
jgi:predicted nucleic acid-binding protein